jgi:hypothetical protein
MIENRWRRKLERYDMWVLPSLHHSWRDVGLVEKTKKAKDLSASIDNNKQQLGFGT